MYSVKLFCGRQQVMKLCGPMNNLEAKQRLTCNVVGNICFEFYCDKQMPDMIEEASGHEFRTKGVLECFVRRLIRPAHSFPPQRGGPNQKHDSM
ncbi:hypothetical protein BGZ80_008058 [Entomortierella chlamydospora]|uniref:Uncharacterized protein n=1 Tax=Entomortierella chlamydospora TaxID=101097 RepID=A0A9P6MDG6_9FUNG|nr:hypothetical protein BGZ80_008058 [Entomortierella chlamydospora]